jgi:dual specificity tyrosine-phosphorylation-regulated kinase 2/3/4
MKHFGIARQYTNENKHFNVVENEEIINYRILKQIGKGAYGKVCLATNKNNNEEVVLKIIKNKSGYRSSAFNEIEFLKKLNNAYKNELRELTSLFYNYIDFHGHIFIELKKYGENLYRGTYDKPLTTNEIRKVAIDLIKGLQFLKKNEIIHADLKPENILFFDDRRDKVVICDFGLSMNIKDVNLKHEVQSIWYRAPEVIFCIDYDYCIDLWGFGCIIFELIYCNALFRGKTQEELFIYFLAFMDTPKNEFQIKNKSIRSFFDLNYKPIPKIDKNIKVREECKKDFLLNYKSKSDTLVNLVLQIIKWDISDRIIIDDCVKMIDDLQEEIKLNSRKTL